MANISLTAPTDYSAELEDIQRRRKLAELMQMQSMQPLESPRPAGGWEIPISPLSGVAKMVQAYGGSKGLESAKTRQQALAERLRGERAQDYSTLAGAMQPTPEKSLAPDPLEADLGGGQYESPQPMNMPARPAGITAATIQQLKTPEAQQAGMGMMAKQSEPYSLAPDATRMVGNTPVARGAPRTVAKPADPEIMRLQTALSLLPEGDPNRAALENRIRNLAKPEPTYKEPELLGGAYVQRENRPGGKVNQVVPRAPVTNVTTTVSTGGEKKYAEERSKAAAQRMADFEKAAESAHKSNEGMDRFLAASATGFQGSLQPIFTGVQNVLASFGYQSKDLVDVRQMEQAIGDVLQNKMAELGARGLTDRDMEILRMALPRVEVDREARKNVANIVKKANNAIIGEYMAQRQEEERIYPELARRIPKQAWLRKYEQGTGQLSPAEQQELQQLRQRFGR